MAPRPRWQRWGSALTNVSARQARVALLFLPNFALAKAAIYFLPLAIATFASAEIYGGIELAQSLGLMIAALALGAPLAGLTQVYLIRGERRIADQIAFVTLAGCAAALILTVLAWLLRLDPLSLMVVASLGVAVLHYVGASVFRMLSWRNFTAWADGTAMLISGLLVVALLMAVGQPTLPQLAAGFFLIGATATLASLVGMLRTHKPGLRERMRIALKVGLPITVVGVLAIWLGVGGRIIVGLLNATALPAYGVAFRVAGLSLGIHQLAITALFAHLYAARTREADRVLGYFFAAVALLSLLIALAGRYLPQFVQMSALEGAGTSTYAAVLPLAALQTFYWIGYAMLQLRINRYSLAGRSIMPTIAVTVGGIGAIFAIGGLVSNDVVLLSWLIAAHGAAYFFTSAWILARRGLPHRRLTIMGAAGGISIAIVAVFAAG